MVTADVGGQKELINDNVGKVIKLRQNEKDIYNEIYSNEEVHDYVDGINTILDNTKEYEKKCRQRIIKYFTIDKMIEKMSNILQKTYQGPNEIKIQNGKSLNKNLNICKELITTNLKNDEIEYRWECTEYEKRIYGRAYSMQGMNYKKEILKENLWKIPVWRGFIKILHKIKG